MLPAMPSAFPPAGRDGIVRRMGRIDPRAGPLPDQRAKFEVDDDVAYFNTASLSPLLLGSRAAGDDALGRRGKLWRIAAEDWFAGVEQARPGSARLLRGSAGDVAILTPSS